MNHALKNKKDVGSGKYKRFQPSNTMLLTKVEVNEKVNIILDLIDHFISHNIGNQTDIEKLRIVEALTSKVADAIKGISTMRGQMIVQLCALLGLLPLDFYTHIPMHLKGGGPRTFMLEFMGWNINENLLEWNMRIVRELQELFNKELTYNMFENGTCKIGRHQRAKDVYFILPRLTADKQMMGNPKECNPHLQIFFRIKGKQNSKWNLQGYAGGSKKVIIFCNNENKHKKHLL